MILLICQDSDQNYHPIHFINSKQLLKLTAIDLKTALINEMFENPRSKTTFGALMYKITHPPSSASMRSPIHMKLATFKKGIKSDDPPQNMDISHLSDPTSTTTNLDETYPLDTSCDNLLHLDSPSLSSELQDTSSVHSVEIEFLPESESKLDHTNLSPTDVFSGQHDYELFLLPKEIDAPNGNLNHEDTHNCENQDDILIHATILSHTFALPQLMAEHNCEDLDSTHSPSTVATTIQATSDQTFNPRFAHNPMATQCNHIQYLNPNHNFALPQFMAQPNSEDLDPTDTPIAVPTAFQASSDHTFNPKCAHNLMETQCNQHQYIIPLNKICAHIPSASQNNQVILSNSLASPYSPDPGEHVLKRSATTTGEQDFPVKWFKFIHLSPEPRMTEILVQKPVHLAYSPIASMNYQWTINLHDGYPLLQGMQPEEYIPPTLHISVITSLPCFTLVMITFAPPKSYCPLETMGRIWKLQPMRKTRPMMTYTSSKH